MAASLDPTRRALSAFLAGGAFRPLWAVVMDAAARVDDDPQVSERERDAFDELYDLVCAATGDPLDADGAEVVEADAAELRAQIRELGLERLGAPLGVMEAADPRRALIERYLDAYNAFDVPAMLALLTPDVTFENRAGGEVTASARGREEFRALAEHAATLFASRRQTIRRYVATANGAEVEIDYEGVLAVDLGPDLPAGATLRLVGRSTFVIAQGRIAALVDES